MFDQLGPRGAHHSSHPVLSECCARNIRCIRISGLLRVPRVRARRGNGLLLHARHLARLQASSLRRRQRHGRAVRKVLPVHCPPLPNPPTPTTPHTHKHTRWSLSQWGRGARKGAIDIPWSGTALLEAITSRACDILLVPAAGLLPATAPATADAVAAHFKADGPSAELATVGSALRQLRACLYLRAYCSSPLLCAPFYISAPCSLSVCISAFCCCFYSHCCPLFASFIRVIRPATRALLCIRCEWRYGPRSAGGEGRVSTGPAEGKRPASLVGSVVALHALPAVPTLLRTAALRCIMATTTILSLLFRSAPFCHLRILGRADSPSGSRPCLPPSTPSEAPRRELRWSSSTIAWESSARCCRSRRWRAALCFGLKWWRVCFTSSQLFDVF